MGAGGLADAGGLIGAPGIMVAPARLISPARPRTSRKRLRCAGLFMTGSSLRWARATRVFSPGLFSGAHRASVGRDGLTLSINWIVARGGTFDQDQTHALVIPLLVKAGSPGCVAGDAGGRARSLESGPRKLPHTWAAASPDVRKKTCGQARHLEPPGLGLRAEDSRDGDMRRMIAPLASGEPPASPARFPP